MLDFRYWECQECGSITDEDSHVNPCPDCDSPTFRSPPSYAAPHNEDAGPLD